MELFDPTSKPTVEDINTVPADFRPMYKEVDGKHVLQADDPIVKSSISVLNSMKGILVKNRKDIEDLKKKNVDLSPLATYGANPTDIAAAVQVKLDELTNQIKGGKVDTDAVKKAVAGEFQGKVDKATARASKLALQLEAKLVTGESSAALANAKAKPGASKALLPLIRQHVKTTIDDEGNFNVTVVDSKGEPRYNGASGAPLSIEEFVGELKADKDFGAMFESDAPNGGGAKPGASQRKAAADASNGGQQRDLSAAELIARGLKNKQYTTAKN